MNSNMITNKTICRIYQSILYLLFLSSKIIEAVLVTFVDIVFATFVDTIFITCLISSHGLTEVSAIVTRYLSFSQIHVLGLKLQSFWHVQ